MVTGIAGVERSHGAAVIPSRGADPQASSYMLVLDDEDSVRASVVTVLRRQGRNILQAKSPAEATQLIANHGGKIDAVITDLIMPESNGDEFARQVLQRWPNSKFVFMTGLLSNDLASLSVPKGFPVLIKPFSVAELRTAIAKALQATPRHEALTQTNCATACFEALC